MGATTSMLAYALLPQADQPHDEETVVNTLTALLHGLAGPGGSA
jgi:hypothetical protein